MKDMATIPKDFSTAVKDIKLAILQARANAAEKGRDTGQCVISGFPCPLGKD